MLSIVVPVCNEQDNLLPLYAEIVAAVSGATPAFEIIFVDDGSTDGSWKVIAELARTASANVQGIRFRRNFGKAAALAAAFRHVRGEFVVTLDADLQDDPAEVPGLLAALEKGTPVGQPEGIGTGVGTLDMVSGWKRIRHDPFHKVWPSRVFNFMVSSLTSVRLHDHNCGMKCYRVEVLREIRLYGELHRFIPVLAAARGFRVGELVVEHRPRRFGRSKYGAWRFVKGFLDLLTVKFLTGFGRRPQHLLGSLGLISFFLGGLALALPCRYLGRPAVGQGRLRTAAPTSIADLRPGRAALRCPDDVDRLSRRVDHGLPEPGRRRLQYRRADETPDLRMNTDKPDSLARSVATLLIAVAVGTAAGHVLTVERVYEPNLSRAAGEASSPYPPWPAKRPMPTPLLRSNDRSRWCTIRALVDQGTYVIGHRDPSQAGPDNKYRDSGIVFEDGWTSVDRVLRPRTGEFYSSKPPLLPTLIAGEYWLLKARLRLDSRRRCARRAGGWCA